MILKKQGVALAFSLTLVASLMISSIHALAAEKNDAVLSAALKTVSIEADIVNEGVEDFELPVDDLQNDALEDLDDFDDGDDDGDDDFYEDPTPSTDFEDLLDEEPLTTTAPISHSYATPARTGEAVSPFVVSGVAGMAVAGIALTIRKSKSN